MGSFLVFVAVVVVIAALVIGAYNSLVRRRMETQNAWSQITVQLKRRYDLIPNLVETVRGYAGHERETLERVVQARNQAIQAQGPAQQASAENVLTGALKSLFAVVEAYPDLKANENFRALQEELTATENRIGFARQHYNDVASQYNGALQSFPTNLVARSLGFNEAEFFHIEGAEAEAILAAPQVKF
ncbi:MAG TPA: LemA family protein [Chloroflexota bacterium]|nr:LemA family protein [Chloroflexota bacterium]